MLQKKTIVITGATSLIINKLIDRLEPNVNRIIGVTRTLKKGLRNDINWIECDLALAHQGYDFFNGADMIIHAAAISNTHHESEYEAVNLQSTVHLVDQAKQHNVPAFVFISSIFAGNENGKYGFSKYQSEQYICNNLNSYLIVRSSQLYGHSDNNPIDRLIRQVSTKKWVFCPIGDMITLYPLHCDHFVNWLSLAIQAAPGKQGIIYCRGPKAYHYHALTKAIVSNMNRKILVIPVFKPLMLLMAKIIRLMHCKTGVYPDQIYRLYHARIEFGNAPQFVSDYQLDDYLNMLKNFNLQSTQT